MNIEMPNQHSQLTISAALERAQSLFDLENFKRWQEEKTSHIQQKTYAL